jgi:hypothetical protein
MRTVPMCFTTSAPLKLLLSVVLGCATLGVPTPIFAEEDRAQLAGTVRDLVTGAPPKGLDVLLEPAGGPQRYMTAPNASGAFSFTSVEPGNYRIALHGQGYRYLPGNQPNALIHLEPGEKLGGIDLAAVPLGSISGTVFDAEGEPLVDARVRVMKPQWRHGVRIWALVSGGLLEFHHTDDRGQYRIDDLEPGEYCIHISPPGIDGFVRPIQDAPGAPEMASIPVYYPHAPTLAEASRVDVGPGQEVSGIDVQVPSERTFHIRGPADPKLADPSAGVFTNSPYVAARHDDGLIKDWAEFTGMIRADGSFDILCVPAGDYRVQIMRRSDSQNGSAAVSIQSADAVGVRLSQTQFDVKIKSRVEGDPTASTPVWASLEPIDRSGATLRTWPQNPDTIQSVSPGRYLLRIRFSPNTYQGGYAKRVLADGEEVTNAALALTGPVTLDVVLAIGTRQIEGSFKGSDPVPPDLSAILVPEQPRPGTWASVYRADIDQRGEFVFWDVPPGDYRAFVVPGYDEGLWENRDFFRFVADRGTVVAVPEGSGEALPIKISPTLLSPVDVERAASHIGN